MKNIKAWKLVDSSKNARPMYYVACLGAFALMTATGCASGDSGSGLSLFSFMKPQPREAEFTEERLGESELQPQQSSRLASHSEVQPEEYAGPNASTARQNQTAVHTASMRRSVPVLHTLGKNEDLSALIQQAPGVVLLDFYADWCGPCKAQGRILHSMEDTAAQLNATVIKVNVDQHKDVARQFQASSLPTLVVLKNGQTLKRKVGTTDRQTLESWLSL